MIPLVQWYKTFQSLEGSIVSPSVSCQPHLYSAARSMAYMAGYLCATLETLAQLCYACQEFSLRLIGFQPHFSEQV